MRPDAKLLNKYAVPITDEAEERLSMYNMKSIEEVKVGDYELHLVQTAWSPYPQIGLQREGRDMTDVEQQHDRTPKERGAFDRTLCKQTIRRWLDIHNGLLVGTFEPSKQKSYAKLLKFLGFQYKTSQLVGHTVLIILP